MSNQGSYELLVEKLDKFIRKFYVNQLFRGILYSIGLVLALFITFNVLEHFFYFSQQIRKVLFFGFIGLSLISTFRWIFVPIIKYFRLGNTISYEQAANIIGTHFSDIKDKLLNVLQLKKQNDIHSNYLIEASIDQKTNEISLIPFKKAIDLKKNRKYLKYALPPLLTLVVLIFAAPSIITDSTHRIINNNKDFEREAPFSFKLNKENLEVVQYQDYTLDIDIEGDALPNEVFVEIDGFSYQMNKKSASQFSYTFKNVEKDIDFRVTSGIVTGISYTLEVIEKPSLTDFSVDLNYPRYIKRKNEKLDNIGDFIVPEGTVLRWQFHTKNTDELKFRANNAIASLEEKEGLFTTSKKVRDDLAYRIYIQNERIPEPDSISYRINVIKDQYPTIQVESFADSSDENYLYFIGNITDDYGFSSLQFHYQIISDDGKITSSSSEQINYSDQLNQSYDFNFDANKIDLAPGQQLKYYFEVKDNDGVNGAKSAKTSVMSLKKISLEALQEEQDKKEEEIKDNLDDSLKDLEKMKEKFKKMREKLLQKKELEFQDKKELEKLLEQQQELQNKLEQAKQNFDQNKESQKKLNQQNQQDLEKQKKLEELFEKVLDPEKQELMEKIQDLLQELEKEDAIQMMEQMEMDNEILEQDMERLEELFKQLEMEKEMKEQIEKLEELAEKQEDLAKKTEEQKESQEDLQKQQEDLNEEMKDIEEKLNELQEKNKELSPPKDLGDEDENQEQMDDIQEDMQQSQEQMEQDQNKDAAKSQKSAAQKMKNMAGNLQSNMQSGEQEQNEEDLKAIRQLLENIVTLSFDQEELVGDFDKTQINTPRYVDLVQTQFKFKDDFRLIEDSLVALSNRVAEIESFVTEKVANIKYNFKESLEFLEERNKSNAKQSQRSAMTNLNDLALMLSESMENMQKQMGASMPGSQQCNKPGGKGQGKAGKVPSDKITEGQESLNKDMEGLKKKAKEGKATAKDFGEAAARQAALRKALQDAKKEKQEQGKGGQELQDIIDDMNKVETDLVNKRFDNEVLNRQKDILTRLLEADKADRQREWDEKRKSEQGKNFKREMPAAIKEYLKQREAELELYKSTSPSLKPYYKSLVDKYFKSLKSK